MKHWYMLTVVGQDRPGIVAHVTAALYEGGCNLGEASMMRLGGTFTIMLMVQHDGSLTSLREMVAPVVESMDLHLHVDQIKGRLHEHLEPDVRISVFGADRAGIVAKVTNALADAGLHILNLESDVGGTTERPLYVMHIEGQARGGIEALRAALAAAQAGDGIETRLEPIETMMG
jgi:glycine cleavage system transcriptional repressor